MTTADKRPVITRTGFSLVPSTLLADCKSRKGTVFVYANLWDHASGEPGDRGNAFPSVETQAKECGMDPKDIREARRWLEINGWLDRKERPGLTPMFKVRLEQRETRSHRPALKGTPGGNAPRVKSPRRPLGQTPHPTPGAYAPPINNPLTRTNDQEVLEPPLPPATQGERRPEAVAAGPCRDRDGFLVSIPEPQPPVAPESPPKAPAAVQPQPQQRPRPEPPPEPAPDPEAIVPVKPQAQKREAGFRPAYEDVPAALLPVVRELLAFWPARNPKGRRTQGAWDRMLANARKIQDHPQGGTEILRQQLEEGTEARVSGPGWLGLDFGRWQQYGTKATTPVMGSGFRGRLTPEESAAEAIAYIRARDAKAVDAAAAATTRQAVLVEVLA